MIVRRISVEGMAERNYDVQKPARLQNSQELRHSLGGIGHVFQYSIALDSSNRIILEWECLNVGYDINVGKENCIDINEAGRNIPPPGTADKELKTLAWRKGSLCWVMNNQERRMQKTI